MHNNDFNHTLQGPHAYPLDYKVYITGYNYVGLLDYVLVSSLQLLC